MNENLQIPIFINENMAERSFDLSTLECLAWFQFNASAAAPQSLKQRLKYSNINILYYNLFAGNILSYHDMIIVMILRHSLCQISQFSNMFATGAGGRYTSERIFN